MPRDLTPVQVLTVLLQRLEKRAECLEGVRLNEYRMVIPRAAKLRQDGPRRAGLPCGAAGEMMTCAAGAHRFLRARTSAPRLLVGSGHDKRATCSQVARSKQLTEIVAESEGFEPPIDLRLCLISSQVHSTGLCQLSVRLVYRSLPRLRNHPSFARTPTSGAAQRRRLRAASRAASQIPFRLLTP